MAEILISTDYREVPPDEYCKLFKSFLERFEFDQLISIATSKSEQQHLAFNVSVLDLLHFDSALAYKLLHHPIPLLGVFETAVQQLVDSLRSHPEVLKRKVSETSGGDSISANALRAFADKNAKAYHVRLSKLPPTSDHTKRNIGQLRLSTDCQPLLQITGTVVRTGSVRMLKMSKEYECTNPKCGYRFRVKADPEQGNVLPQPTACPAPRVNQSSCKKGGKGRGGRGGSSNKCVGFPLREVDGTGEVVDYQEIKIQDQMERLQMGQSPRALIVVLEADLVDKFSPGDDIIVTGTLQKRWRPVFPGQRCQVQVALRANSVRLLHASANRRAASLSSLCQFQNFWKQFQVDASPSGNNSVKPHPHEARNQIVAAVCPQLHGMFYVKLCLLLTLIGGSRTDADSAVALATNNNLTKRGDPQRRYQSHMLMVGDPGTGKSQLLKFASALLPRSVMTTGVGTTGAGLTCTAIRDGADWVLEAGALVLANGGVCCIDEFASIKEQDRATIHEAMEQQTLSVAKAGMVTKLNTRCSVIAVCNPKGHQYDVQMDICSNTNIASPLLSRFDLVLVLLDVPKKDWDKQISTFLLNTKVKGGKSRMTQVSHSDKQSDEHLDWDITTLRDYVLLVRDRLHPQLTGEARCLLMRYYQLQRQQDAALSGSGRTTVRALESSIRLAEAHAKLMFHSSVTFEDAVVAISCMELSSSLTSNADKGQTLHSNFPSCAATHYMEVEDKILGFLQYSRKMVERDLHSRSEFGEMLSSGPLSSAETESSPQGYKNSSATSFPRKDISSPSQPPTDMKQQTGDVCVTVTNKRCTSIQEHVRGDISAYPFSTKLQTTDTKEVNASGSSNIPLVKLTGKGTGKQMHSLSAYPFSAPVPTRSIKKDDVTSYTVDLNPKASFTRDPAAPENKDCKGRKVRDSQSVETGAFDPCDESGKGSGMISSLSAYQFSSVKHPRSADSQCHTNCGKIQKLSPPKEDSESHFANDMINIKDNDNSIPPANVQRSGDRTAQESNASNVVPPDFTEDIRLGSFLSSQKINAKGSPSETPVTASQSIWIRADESEVIDESLLEDDDI